MVFVGEVVIVLGILAMSPFVHDAVRDGAKPRFDLLGAILSAVGLGAVVLGTLQASTWGWLKPKDSPVEPFGFSLTFFVVAAGGVLLWAFVRWQRHREATGTDPLVHLDLFKIPPVRSGLIGMLSQNLILMGVFFTVPLYLQMVLGLDALETGIKMLPVSVMMFIAAAAGSRLSARYSVRSIVRAGLDDHRPRLHHPPRDDRPRAERARLRPRRWARWASAWGSSPPSSATSSSHRWTRRAAARPAASSSPGNSSARRSVSPSIGAVVLTGLTSVFLSNVESDPALSDKVASQVSVAVGTGIDFVSTDQIEAAAQDAGLSEAETTALVGDYEDAQLQSLKLGLLLAAFLALGSLVFTRDLPRTVPPDEVEATAAIGAT